MRFEGGGRMGLSLVVGDDMYFTFFVGIELYRTLFSHADIVLLLDGFVPVTATIPYVDLDVLKDNFGPVVSNTLPGYWEQSPNLSDTSWCGYMQSLPDELLSVEEKFLACKTKPRTPPKHIDLDLMDSVKEQIRGHDYEKGPILEFISTAMMHLPLAYPKEYDDLNPNLPKYFAEGHEKPQPNNDDLRLATASALRFLDDLFGSTMQALKDADQWNNTIVLFTSDNGGAIYGGHAHNNYPLRASKFSPFEGNMTPV
jgi:hypothetical protein